MPTKRGALQSINEEKDCFNALYFQPLEEGKIMRGYSRKVQDTNNGNALWHRSKLPYGIGEHGDSGGPLITYVQERGNNIPYVIGVVSGGVLANENPNSKVNYVEPPEIADNEPPASMYGKYKSVFAPTVFSVLNSIQISATIKYMLKKANLSS